MAENIYHNILTIEKGKVNLYHDRLNVLPPTEELFDINNDFRSREYWTLEDITNDIRTIPPKEELFDLDNDFRMFGTFTILDINNDFRFADYADINFNNDFRMVGEIIRGDLYNDFRDKKEVLSYIKNKINTTKTETININNKFNNCIEVVEDVNHTIIFVNENIKNISCDFRTKKDTRYEVSNDFRMISSWQLPQEGAIGFQSRGKEYVKVYISSVEQTDVDIDSISINWNLNNPYSASFDLGRPYDNTKPSMKAEVEIKYDNWALFRGYITEINPSDSPESITINAQGEYWNLNFTKKYFFVGRKPADTKEYYFTTIKEALVDLGFNYDIGDFIPQTIDLYGSGVSDAITQLVTNSGNYSWFITPDGTKKLKIDDAGEIINLPLQKLGENLGLYQVIRQSITESIVNIVNKFRVLMGNWTIKKASDDPSKGSGSKTYIYTWNKRVEVYGIPAWNKDLEKLAKNSGTGYGWDWQDSNIDYSDVFKKFYLPDLDPKYESWTDIYPPLIEVIGGWGQGYYGGEREYMSEGFTLDYGYNAPFGYPIEASDLAKPKITFSEEMVEKTISDGKLTKIKTKIIKLYLWKEKKVSYTLTEQTSPNDAPIEDELNPMMFYTDKMGDYPDTIIEDLNLSDLSKQEGYIVKDNAGKIIEIIPSWDDRNFARDFANWQLSKNCDKKIMGSIDLTIDALLQYNIDLSKRIKIENIIDPININSITINFNNWIATLNIENLREYHRTESLSYRGE